MAARPVIDLIDEIVRAGVAVTTRALSDAAPELDLTFPQWRTLLIVGESPDGATVSEVAAAVGVTLPATSRQLRRLSRRGLLQIGPDERDRRASRVTLTAAGRSVLDAILRYRLAHIRDAAGHVEVSTTTVHELSQIAATLAAPR